MTSVKLKLHKNKLLKDGTYPLVFQIIHNRRKNVLYTNYKIRESDFDPVSGKVRADDSRQLSDRSAQRMNRALNRERKTLLSKIAFYEEHGIDFCVEDLDNRSSRQHNVHLLQYMNKQIREKILARRNGTAEIPRGKGCGGERNQSDVRPQIRRIPPQTTGVGQHDCLLYAEPANHLQQHSPRRLSVCRGIAFQGDTHHGA